MHFPIHKIDKYDYFKFNFKITFSKGIVWEMVTIGFYFYCNQGSMSVFCWYFVFLSFIDLCEMLFLRFMIKFYCFTK